MVGYVQDKFMTVVFTVDSFSLKAGETEVRVINVGCSVKDILVPDKDGKVADVCLGYDDLKSKFSNMFHFE